MSGAQVTATLVHAGSHIQGVGFAHSIEQMVTQLQLLKCANVVKSLGLSPLNISVLDFVRGLYSGLEC